MELHIVSGFLGSGKTTAIIGAAKQMMAKGKDIGVVTNDQGKYLVDTAFFDLSAVPAVEVTGGCFCCHFDDLEARLNQLQHTAKPDIIFAESVGSCADIVATVVKPLLELRDEGVTPTSFSVFTDTRLLRRRLLGLPMPFSDDVVYIFDKQIEEAGILVINKRDLLSDSDAQKLVLLAQAAFPSKVLQLQNSLDPGDIGGWISLLNANINKLQTVSLDIDYQRYGIGERKLAWLDETVVLHTLEGEGRKAALTFLATLKRVISTHNLPIGHIKVIIKGAYESVKLSFVAEEVPGWEIDVPELSGASISILLNARVEGDPELLREIVHEAILATESDGLTQVEESAITSFHPGYPKPTHRIGNQSSPT
jgi:Ni2+-binding GTPase involved in maturation of urease and hydrogenase